jgi:hypothetical protein
MKVSDKKDMNVHKIILRKTPSFQAIVNQRDSSLKIGAIIAQNNTIIVSGVFGDAN